jgi:hypothetical protein
VLGDFLGTVPELPAHERAVTPPNTSQILTANVTATRADLRDGPRTGQHEDPLISLYRGTGQDAAEGTLPGCDSDGHSLVVAYFRSVGAAGVLILS